MLSEAQGAKTIITTFLRWHSAPFRVNSAADCEHAAMQGLSTVQSLCASLISAIKNLFFICLFIFLSYSGLNINWKQFLASLNSWAHIPLFISELNWDRGAHKRFSCLPWLLILSRGQATAPSTRWTSLQTQSWSGTPRSECWDHSHTPSWVSLSLESTMPTWRHFRRTIYAWVPDSLKKESGEHLFRKWFLLTYLFPNDWIWTLSKN